MTIHRRSLYCLSSLKYIYIIFYVRESWLKIHNLVLKDYSILLVIRSWNRWLIKSLNLMGWTVIKLSHWWSKWISLKSLSFLTLPGLIIWSLFILIKSGTIVFLHNSSKWRGQVLLTWMSIYYSVDVIKSRSIDHTTVIAFSMQLILFYPHGLNFWALSVLYKTSVMG